MYYFSDEGDTMPYITTGGFQFLLMDTATQIWFFMLQYLDMVDVSESSSTPNLTDQTQTLV